MFQDELQELMESIIAQGQALDELYASGRDVVTEAAQLAASAQEVAAAADAEAQDAAEAAAAEDPDTNPPPEISGEQTLPDDNYIQALMRDIWNDYEPLESVDPGNLSKLARAKVPRDLQAMRAASKVPSIGGGSLGGGSASAPAASSSGEMDFSLLGAVMSPGGVKQKLANYGRSLLDLTPVGWALEIAGWFGGGDEVLPDLIKYAMPAGVSFDAVERGGRMYSGDRDQGNAPRAYGDEWGRTMSYGGDGLAPGAAAAVPVEFDSQFWSDHADAISHAVRGSMLQGHAINGVITDEL